jgi:hypothetical protein
MSKMGTITLEGCSGENYEFSIYPLGTNFKSVGGVYYISKRIDRTHSHIYLGITDSLSSRFDNHHKQKCFDKNGANCISVHVSESEEEREIIEKDILCKYSFSCNETNN